MCICACTCMYFLTRPLSSISVCVFQAEAAGVAKDRHSHGEELPSAPERPQETQTAYSETPHLTQVLPMCNHYPLHIIIVTLPAFTLVSQQQDEQSVIHRFARRRSVPTSGSVGGEGNTVLPLPLLWYSDLD